ncbi:metallophosphoesterase [Halogeometricum sp. S1BR25-6]|uniref:Metallophosphoesterase n=1 Tax=Halogeometricum salsisoli TaxID=2950536 RepID=A0ABU2GGF1_9EURY|nr:metallophosphoesterase [Halogeometricum sp. S1BR25-6]MDS0299368.1 metallophosphoesterase [Halogeometricum sp. S1BR25-6]
MTATYEDLGNEGTYELPVQVVKCRKSHIKNRAYEMTVSDVNGTEFEFIVWEKSTLGSSYEWKEGCWYRLSGISANVWPAGTLIHGTSRLKINRLERGGEENRVEILYMTDSHLGKTTHGYGRNTWSVSPEAGFSDAIDYAVNRNVNAVVHGGDLYHNSKTGITDEDVTLCREKLSDLFVHNIPFYYIYGNHEREAGRREMEELVEDGIATHLSSRPEIISDTVSIYGVDHQYEWTGFELERPPSAVPTVLFIHQSVSPFTAKKNPDCSFRDLMNTSNVPIDLTITGHVHTRKETTVGRHRGLSGGSTGALGDTKGGLQPSVEMISVKGGDVTVQQHHL